MKNELKYLLTKTKFPYLWASQLLSQLTINMMNYLLLIKLYENTNSTLAISLLWVSYALPVILIGPFAYALVDILDRRLVLITTNLIQSMIIFLYAVYAGNFIFGAYGIVFFYSCLNQFYVPSESSSITSLVDKEHLPQANGMFFVTQQLSLVLGFGLASVIGNFLGFGTSFYICAILIFMAFLSVLFLPKMKVSDNKKGAVENNLVTFFQSIYSGYRYIRRNKNIFITLMTMIFIQVMFSIIVVSVPAISEEILKVPAKLSGIYLVIPAGIGSMLGAIYIPMFLRNKWRKRQLIETSLLVISILLLLETVLIRFLPIIPRIIISFVFIMFVGVFFTGILIPAQTFLQENTEEEFKGRIFGNMWFVTTIATVVPIIFYGLITELFGIRLVLVLISTVCFIMYYLSTRKETKFLNNVQQ